jgi:hypothetical protein
MKKLFSFFCVTLYSFISFQAQAQYTLDQVDMSLDTVNTVNTYMMDINNRAYSCGYYTKPNGDNVGFIITRKGVEFHIDNNVIAGCFDIKVVSINDNDVALVSTTIGGVTTLYKFYVADENISAPVLVTGVAQNPVNALKINNKNDISGWYQGVNSRWLFILHDSIIPPGMPQWQASRYMPAAVYYNTWGAGMDSNNNIAGYYLDAPNFYPFLYNATANTYQTLTAPAKTKVWDMNNNHMMVGEYQQVNGFYMAFWGDITGNTLNVNSLANIFHNNTIQSVANGVNDKGYVVGSFIDPNTGKWKGFIYRPGQDKFEYPGYSFTRHTWKMENSEDTTIGNTTSHWNQEFFDQYVDYGLFDTYMYNGDPLYDSLLKKKFKQPGNQIPNWLHPDWKSFATESDKLFTPNGSPHDKAVYKKFKKYKMFDKYVKFLVKEANSGVFDGDCYGFSTTSLMSYCDQVELNQKYDIPMNVNLSTITNMDSLAKGAITRGQLLQYNPNLSNLYVGIDPWDGLYRTKTYMSDTLQKVNIRTLGIVLVDGVDTGGHAIFPYQIRTPKKLPFKDPVTLVTSTDTVMIYDSNYPQDSTQFLTVKSDWNFSGQGFYSPNYNLIWVNFDEPTFTQLLNTPFAALKKLRSADTIYDFCFSANTDYVINTGGAICSQVNNIYSNGIPQLKPIKGTGPSAFRPLYFMADSLDTYAITLNQYKDSVMSIVHTTDDLSMGINRFSMPSEKDYLSVGRKKISYGNPENITKSLTCHFVQTSDGADHSINLVADNLTMAPNDSVITLSPYDYSYQIIHPGGAPLTYNLELYALYTDTIKHFVSNGVSMSSNTSHLIDPYYVGANGTQTVIYVDNGLNGNHDDTLFVQEIALDLNETFKNVSYVNVYPNPAKDDITIAINQEKAQEYTIVVADMYGKIINRESVTHAAGTSLHTIDLRAKQTGVYYVILYNKNQQALFMEKIVKE